MVKFDEPTMGSVWIVPDGVKFVQAHGKERTRVYFGTRDGDYLLLDHPVEYVVEQLWPPAVNEVSSTNVERLNYSSSFPSKFWRWLRGFQD